MQLIEAILLEPVGCLAEFPAAPFHEIAARLFVRKFARQKPSSQSGSRSYWHLLNRMEGSDQAQEEANRTLELARQKADQLASKELVAQEAQRRAELILSQARSDADTIRDDADDYVAKSLSQLQAELERISNQVANGIRVVQDEQERRAAASQTVDK